MRHLIEKGFLQEFGVVESLKISVMYAVKGIYILLIIQQLIK